MLDAMSAPGDGLGTKSGTDTYVATGIGTNSRDDA